VAAQHAGGMGIVDHHDDAVLFGGFHQTRERTDIAVHGKDAVADEQLVAGNVVQFGENLFGGGHVFVREDVDLGARKAAAIDDAGVVELVGDDVVVGSEDGGDGAGVGGKPGLEHHASLDILEGGDALFELHVDAHGAGDGADGAGANAEILHRLDGGFPQL